MASNPTEIVNKDGSKTYKIQWREKGKPGQQARSFHNRAKALLFKKLVEVGGRGNNMCPSDEELIRRGLLDPAAAGPRAASPSPSVVTVGQAMKMWLTWLETVSEQSPEARTMDGYRSTERNYLAGTALAEADVATVMPNAIREWLRAQADRPRRDRRPGTVSNASLNHAITIMSTLFKWCTSTASDPTGGNEPLRRWASPMTEIKRRAIPRKNEDDEKDVFFNQAEYEQFIKAAYTTDPQWADMVVTTAFSGCRFGEITALTVGQVDFKRGRIFLDRRYSADQPVLGLKGSKPGSPITRYTRLPQQIMDLLRILCKDKPKSALVFTGPRFGFLGRWIASVDNARWKTLVEMLHDTDPVFADRTYTHHNLRHSYVTLLQANGFAASIAGLAVGHIGKASQTSEPENEGSKVTRIYTHLTEETWLKILAVLEPMLVDLPEIRQRTYEWQARRLTA